jgi:hypothetical protein
MTNKIFKKAMGFLQQPTKAFDAEKGTEVTDSFVYMAILTVVVAVLSAIVAGVTTGSGIIIGITMVTVYVGSLIFNVIAGLWLHLWAYIFGAKKGLNQTLKTVFYAGTPTYLLGWIPLINILAALWGLYLDWMGLQRLHGMEGGRAAAAIVIAFIIPMIILGILFLIGLAILGSMGGLGPEGMFPSGFPY